MNNRQQTAVVDVFLALVHPASGDLLFGLRAAHLYAGGQYNLVSGKAEPGESGVAALIREAREEAGITLEPADLRPLGAVHTVGGAGQPRVALVYEAVHQPNRHGPVANMEPEKCDRLVWAPVHRPPHPLELYNAAALTLVSVPGLGIVTHGWPSDEHRLHLDPRWFDLVKSGAKTVELRLADQRRAALHPGHQITFTAAGRSGEHTTRIAWIRCFPQVTDALNEIDPQAVGGPGATGATVRAAFERIYGDRARDCGVMAIGLTPSF